MHLRGAFPAANFRPLPILKANFSCAENRGKIPTDHKQQEHSQGWNDTSSITNPPSQELSGSAAEWDEFPLLGCAFHSSRVQHLWAAPHAFGNRLIQAGDSLWEALKVLAQVWGKYAA